MIFLTCVCENTSLSLDNTQHSVRYARLSQWFGGNHRNLLWTTVRLHQIAYVFSPVSLFNTSRACTNESRVVTSSPRRLRLTRFKFECPQSEKLGDGLSRKRFQPSKGFSNPSTCPALTEKAQLCARLPAKYSETVSYYY